MLTMFRNQEPVIEYEKYAYVNEENKFTMYKITNWIGDDYFKTEYGTFLWDDSKAKELGRKVTKEKIIIRLVCQYFTEDLHSNEHLNGVTERSEKK